MLHGYFAGLRLSMYRRTRDGRRVVAKRRFALLKRRWYLVTEETRDAFERRVTEAHVASLIVIALAAPLLGEPDAAGVAIFFGLVLLVVCPAMQAWMMRGLPVTQLRDADLEPVDRGTRELDYARALGASTLWGLVVVALVLLAPQIFVAVTDGVWWAWLGTAMFGAMSVYFSWLLSRLRKSRRVSRAT